MHTFIKQLPTFCKNINGTDTVVYTLEVECPFTFINTDTFWVDYLGTSNITINSECNILQCLVDLKDFDRSFMVYSEDGLNSMFSQVYLKGVDIPRTDIDRHNCT